MTELYWPTLPGLSTVVICAFRMRALGAQREESGEEGAPRVHWILPCDRSELFAANVELGATSPVSTSAPLSAFSSSGQANKRKEGVGQGYSRLDLHASGLPAGIPGTRSGDSASANLGRYFF